MLGAICGDVIGSRHEHSATKTTDFELLHPRCRGQMTPYARWQWRRPC
jgi:hypothetical protein